MKLKIGDEAPEIITKDKEGNPITLSSFRGKKVVLYFYPKDDTPTCTKQACNLRDNYEALQKAGYIVIGVSADTAKSHTKFITKYSLPFSLISDPGLEFHKLYDVWGEKTTFGKTYMGTMRTTFVIDENGTIADIISNVESGNHAAQILK
jgi:peroxiredoxin Q/BCP